MDAGLASDLRERFPPEQKYLIGVSGGRDSMALWHWLESAGFRNLVVCHLNHQLRGIDSDQDETFVGSTAESAGATTETARRDVRTLAAERKLSIETAARQARHEFFAEMAQKHGCPDLFLAHHADDQVETALINLCRGSGPGGFAGMTLESEIVVGEVTLRLIRPWLNRWRTEIDDDVAEHGIAYREDATNAKTAGSARNRIRHELIPLMGDIFDRDVRKAIHRFASISGEEHAAMESILDEIWSGLIRDGGEGLETACLLQLDEAVRRRAIHRWLGQQPGLPACGSREVAEVNSIISPQAEAAKVNLPGGWHARRKEGLLFLQPPN